MAIITFEVDKLYTTNEGGDVRASTVEIKVHLRRDGGEWQEVVTDCISGKITTPFRQAYNVRLPA